MRVLSFAAPIVLLSAVSTTAYADRCDRKAEDKAQEFFEEGKRAYRLEEYEKAIEAFKAGYALCGNPVFLLNVGLACKQMNDFRCAISFYKSYLKEDPTADNRAKLEARIAEMEKALEEQAKTKEKPPTEVEPPTTTTTPPPPPAETPPPEATPPVATPPAEPEPGPRVEPWYRDRWGWVLVSSGVAMMGVGGGLFFYGASLHDDALAEQDEGDVKSLIESANTFRALGAGLFWSGAAVAVAGGIKLALTDRPRARATAMSVGPGWFFVSGSF